MRTIIINTSNHVENTDNQYVYTFPSTVKFSDGDAIGVSSVAIYNSTFNITSLRGNNTFTIAWNAAATTTFTITIPDGYYSVENLNFFLQQQCILNNLYVTNASGQNVYFLEFIINPPRYAVSLNAYPIPTAAQATTLGYTQPVGATWTYPAAAQCPQITFGTPFGALIGYTAASYPTTSSVSTIQNFISDLTPNLNVVDSYIMTCSLINSPYSIPSDAFFTIPLTAGLGSLISVFPSEIVFNDIAPNSYQQIKITFFDQNFNRLEMNDNQLTLSLAILNKNEREYV
jgi:hypothetical protein